MDFARNERGFCVGFAWNLILFSFVREREGYKHHADCTVSCTNTIDPLHAVHHKEMQIGKTLTPRRKHYSWTRLDGYNVQGLT